MQEAQYLGRIEPGMDVCDMNGEKIGTIQHVYRHELSRVGGTSDTSETATLPHEDVLEVKTGLMGLGKHYYVPFGAIQDVTTGCVFVKEPKERLADTGWDVKPDHLDKMGL
jgi:hypothetical protein